MKALVSDKMTLVATAPAPLIPMPAVPPKPAANRRCNRQCFNGGLGYIERIIRGQADHERSTNSSSTKTNSCRYSVPTNFSRSDKAVPFEVKLSFQISKNRGIAGYIHCLFIDRRSAVILT